MVGRPRHACCPQSLMIRVCAQAAQRARSSPAGRQRSAGPHSVPDLSAGAIGDASSRAVPVGRRPGHRRWRSVGDHHAGRAQHVIGDAWRATAFAGQRRRTPNPDRTDGTSAQTSATLAGLGSRCRDGWVADFSLATSCPVYFCDPHSAWQRGTDENTNGLLRQYYPRSRTEHRDRSQDDLDQFAVSLNLHPARLWAGQPQPRDSTTSLLQEPLDSKSSVIDRQRRLVQAPCARCFPDRFADARLG